jgi:hypothetical protein
MIDIETVIKQLFCKAFDRNGYNQIATTLLQNGNAKASQLHGIKILYPVICFSQKLPEGENPTDLINLVRFVIVQNEEELTQLYCVHPFRDSLVISDETGLKLANRSLEGTWLLSAWIRTVKKSIYVGIPAARKLSFITNLEYNKLGEKTWTVTPNETLVDDRGELRQRRNLRNRTN